MNGINTNTNGNGKAQTAPQDSTRQTYPNARTHIVCIVDRSGSMQPIAGDAIGGYNSFIEKQRELPGDAVVTLVLFDHEYFHLCSAVPLAEAPRLDQGNYIPRGTTALLDAMGRTMEDVRRGATASQAIGEKVIVAILTDGLENASTDYTFERIAERIGTMQQEHGWEFVYLGANQDAISVASRMNIPAASSASFEATGTGVRHAYAMMNEQVAYMRSSADVPRRRGTSKKRG